MNPQGLWDLDPLGNHKHLCALCAGVYIGFRGDLNPVDPSVSSYNLYIYAHTKVKMVIGVSVSELHTSVFNCNFSYYLSYVIHISLT